MSETQTTMPASQDQARELLPVRVLEIEISQPLPILSTVDEKTGKYYPRAFCLIRFHSQPLGMIEIPFTSGQALPEEYAQLIWQVFQEQISQHLQKDGLPAPTELEAAGLPSNGTPPCEQKRAAFLTRAPFASIIVPTRDHPDCLAECLEALVRLEYPRYEILVVDNAPATTAAADLISQHYGHDPRVRYLLSEKAGASRARTLGMHEARGEILAFTDDDAVVDAHWLTELAMAFESEEKVVCVTGAVCTLRLETLAQLWFVTYFRGMEDHSKMKRIFLRQVVESQMYYRHLMGNLGGSVNMATTAAFLRHIGGFDPALGPGTPTQAAEDVEVFIHANMHGYTYVYEPSALVYHLDRADFPGIEKQIHGYGTSVLVVLMTCMWQYPQISLNFARYVFSKLFSFLRTEASSKPVKTKKTQEQASGAKWGELLGWEGEKQATKRVMLRLLTGIIGGPSTLVRSVVFQRNHREKRANRRSPASLCLPAPVSLLPADLPEEQPVLNEHQEIYS